jgi:chromosome segregation ATPase
LSEQLAALSTSLQTADSAKSSHAAELEALHAQLEAERTKLASSANDISALADLRTELGKTKSHAEDLEEKLRVSIESESGLRDRIAAMEKELETARGPPVGKKLKAKVEQLEKEVGKVQDLEKELEEEKKHEDLLVLLEELSQKRKRDKAKMKEKGMEVSEGEEDDDEEAEDDE